MSMHNRSEGSFDRINKSMPETKSIDPGEDQQKSKKRCIVIILLVCILAAAILALILVLVFKGGADVIIPNGRNGFTIVAQQDGKWYWEALLKRTLEVEFPIPVDNTTNREFTDLRMRVSMMNDHTFRIRTNPILPDANSLPDAEDLPRWEVPEYIVPNAKDDYGMRLTWANFQAADKHVGVQLSNPQRNNNIRFSTQGRNLIFTDKYLEQGFLIDSRRVFGFGERHRTLELNTGNYTSWANGRDNEPDPGDLGHNSYGDHPFVYARLNDGTFLGIFFRNSNAKVLEYTHAGSNQSILNFRAIGGILDFFTFFGETAEEVIQAYHNIIGKPYFPPFWTLGFHQSSWQYNDTNRIDRVRDGYKNAGMPLECMWLDIEYMDGYRNFKINTTRFPDMLGLSKKIHNDNQKLVTIVDAGFAANKTYEYYVDANKTGLFIKSAQNPELFDGNLIGDVWPGKSAFIDFLHPQSTQWWVNALVDQFEITSMDGVWIDMNEATTFCQGECPTPPAGSKVGNMNLPFDPTGGRDSIEYFSLSLDGQHYHEDPVQQMHNVEYNMHSLYGTMQSYATQRFWYDKTVMGDKRPFVLSRSTFAGAGKWTSHWTGDNNSTWQFMKFSVAEIINFNTFGIPLVGADVCGFHGKYDNEMCGRWMQLAAFYPFARNHYNLTNWGKEFLPEQEPYNLIEPYKEMSRLAIIQRYRFLRFYYTKLYEVTSRGGTMVRPLFFEFPNDELTYQDYEHTFMIGNALKVTPVLDPASVHGGQIQSYFPANSRFISLNDMKTVVAGGDTGKNQSFPVSDTYTIVHMNEGTIIPYQDSSDTVYPNRTVELLKSAISIIAFPNTNGRATGTVYIDADGDSRKKFENQEFQYFEVQLVNTTIRFNNLGGKGVQGDTTTGNQVLKEILILGMNSWKGKEISACAYDTNMQPKEIAADYDDAIDAVRIGALDGETLLFKNILSIQFSDAANDGSFCNVKYTVKGVTRFYESDNAITTKIELDITSGDASTLPDLKATFTLEDDTILRVEINDPKDTKAFKAPKETFGANWPPSTGPSADISSILSLPKEGEQFYYEVHQMNNPSNVYYSTKGRSFVYSKFYKKTTAGIDSTGKIFGLSERVGDFFLGEGVYTIWNRDEPSPIENGKRPGNNIYGTHPVYFTQMTTNNQFFGVFDHNVGAQDYIIRIVDKKYQITQIKTTGVTDQYILLADGIQNVIRNFHKIVGLPVMVPEWSLGWHQCRYGYNSSEQVNQVVEKYLEYNLPLDVMWTDIDYMEQYRDFTLSTSDFKDLPARIAEWRQKNIRYIPILDAAVAYEPDSKDTSYSRLLSKKLYIADGNDNTSPFIGKVWPGPAVYIDWLKNGAEQYWIDEMTGLHKQLPFDGMWIDMNEAANFCNGACTPDQIVKNSVQDQIFYIPGARDLNIKAISVDAKHENDVLEIDAHSTYGFYMSKATSKYFSDQNKRPFVITRSTYSGVGKYASHWLGDNWSDFKYLKYSVGGVFMFNMYGVPVAGADICGFIADTNPDLCARWYALGAFYPFARNHNDKAAIPQEPYVPMFSERNIEAIQGYTYTDFIREASWRRYALHRYQYSHLHLASVDGTPYFTPLFYKYPEDAQSYNNVEFNVMLGDSVKLSPNVQNDENVQFYFPEKGATWCPIWPKYHSTCFVGQSVEKMILPLDEILVHIKSGSIIPLQLGDLKSVPKNINLASLQDIPLDLGILTDKDNKARGWVRYDDGETRNLDLYTEFSFSAKGTSSSIWGVFIDIDFTVEKDDSLIKNAKNQNLGSIVFYNSKAYGFYSGAKAKLTLKSGVEMNLPISFDDHNSISRFLVPADKPVNLRDVKNIHINKN